MKPSEYILEKGMLIEQQLQQLIPEKNVPYQSLFQAARYSLLGAGKKIRPILALAAAEVCGGDLQAALIPACALEMVHTYSLIHDDLPCMDDDDFRRGKPTLHKKFSEGQAVLAGDFLLTEAFSVLAKAPHLNAQQKIALVAILGRQAGGDGMIAGQIMDIEAEGKKIDLAALTLIHQCKTGAMLTASLEFGGVIAGAGEQQLSVLRQFGENIGLAFQIIDDVLDVTASQQKHGKTIASDLLNDKATYVTLLGVEKSKNLADEALQRALKHLEKLSNPQLLKELAEFIVYRQL